MYKPKGNLFDVDNFFQQPSEHMFESSNLNDPTGLIERMNRFHTSMGFPSYPNPSSSWTPVSRIDSYASQMFPDIPQPPLTIGNSLPTTQHVMDNRTSFYPTNTDPFRNETFRIRMSLPGYEREDIKTLVDNGRLVIFARHIQWLGNDDYVANEMKKHFFVPENCDFNEMKTSYDGRNLFINIPLRKAPRSRAASTSSYSRRSSESYRSMTKQRQDSAATNTTTSTNDTHRTAESVTRGTMPTAVVASPNNDDEGVSSATTSPQMIHHSPSFKSSYKVTPRQTNHFKGSLTSLSTLSNAGTITTNSISEGNKGFSKLNSKSTKSESEMFNFEEFFRSSFRPSIMDVSPGAKKLTMSLPLTNVSPDDINLSLKDNLLTLKVVEAPRSHSLSDGNDFSKVESDHPSAHYVRSILLPPKTDLDGLKSRLDNGVLLIEAPYKLN